MYTNYNFPELKALQAELKDYWSKKLILKNDYPLKYWLLNTNLFIHLSFGFWIIWQLWVLSAFLSPTNNSTIVTENNVKVIFESAFLYIYQNQGSNLSSPTTANQPAAWFETTYLFLWLSFILLIISIYTFILVKNFVLDIKDIAQNKSFFTLSYKCKKLNLYWSIGIVLIVIFFFWTVISFLIPPIVESNTVSSILFQPAAHSSKSYTLPLTKTGLATLIGQFVAMFAICYYYVMYCYEKYINNDFFFSEGRSYTPISDKKEAKKFNKKNNKNKLFSLQKAKFMIPNTEGYISELTNVNKIYYVDNKPFFALKNVNLKIKEGEFIVILGPSGSGKTTLLNILSGIDKPTNGQIILSDCDTTKMTDKDLNLFRRKNIGYIFQHYALLCNLTAKENVDIVNYLNKDKTRALRKKKFKEELRNNKNIITKTKTTFQYLKDLFLDKDLNNDVEKLLQVLNLSEHSHKYPHQLSGGQQQRVAIARALIKRPKILFGDEATGALDSDTSKKILELFQLINKYGKTTVIIITHNPSIAKIANRVLYVSDGYIAKDIINPKPLKISELKNL